MKKKIIALVILIWIGAFGSQAQQIPVIRDTETAIIEPLKLNGPRFGVTYFPNINRTSLAENLSDSGAIYSPWLSQFGWQFELRYFETPDGAAGLVEIIPLIGGFEQGLLLPSLNVMAGYRTGDGFELGFGPNLSLAGTAAVLAVGYTFKSEYMNFPVNLAIVPGSKGTRFSFLVGFNKRSR